MSSHHVIRENQEPALLIQDFHALDLESLGQLLEWSPTVVTDYENFDCLLAEEIKVDILFSNQPIASLQENTKLFTFEGTFLRDSLQYLIDQNHKAVNILTSSIPKDLESLASAINIVVFCNQKRFVYVKSTFEKWKPQAELVYVEERFLKSFQGLEHVSKDLFRTVADGFIMLEFNTSDFVLLGEDL